MAPLGTANEPRNAAGAQEQPVIDPAETLHHLSTVLSLSLSLSLSVYLPMQQRCTWRDNAEFEAAARLTRTRASHRRAPSCLMSVRAIVYDGRGDEG